MVTPLALRQTQLDREVSEMQINDGDSPLKTDFGSFSTPLEEDGSLVDIAETDSTHSIESILPITRDGWPERVDFGAGDALQNFLVFEDKSRKSID